ncbi:MAG: alpha-1,6-glucosidase domain-containing protein [Anaerolineales bacterium]
MARGDRGVNTGPGQIPALIVMSISDMVGENLDPNYDQIVDLFNAVPKFLPPLWLNFSLMRTRSRRGRICSRHFKLGG